MNSYYLYELFIINYTLFTKKFFPAFNPAIAVHVAAAGNRNCTTGALANVGTSGYAWSSSPNSSTSVNAGNLGFDASVVNPLNNNNRANGFPVRCVQHLSLFLSFLTIFEPEQHIHCL